MSSIPECGVFDSGSFFDALHERPGRRRLAALFCCAVALVLLPGWNSAVAQDGAGSTADGLSAMGVPASQNIDGGSDQSVSMMPSRAVTLSADQIISVLQQNPDLTAELKQLIVDRMQQQGVQADPASISSIGVGTGR